jgi:5'-3' exonuclease
MSIALIDFSSLFHRLYHVNREEVEQKIQSFLNSLPVYDDVIICLDSPPYKRKEIDGSYKANRDTPDPELVGSLRQCIKKVADSGYAIAGCDGWEADDVIATLVAKNTEESITVYGTDKDLLQCTDLNVPFTNDVKTPENTLGVPRDKVVDYLCLVGDTSDNVKGIDGIGPKRAQDALAKFGSLSDMYETLKNTPSAFSDKTAKALLESLLWIDTTRKLITLNSNLDVKIEKQECVETCFVQDEKVTGVQAELTQASSAPQTAIQKAPEPQYIVKTETIDYRHSLEPVGTDGAFRFAKMACESGLYPKFKGPAQHMMAVMRGRVFGLDATTSLDAIEMIQGKPTLKAQLIAGIIMASPKCEFLECSELSSASCTWETKRVGNRSVQSRTWTIQDAEKMGLNKKDNWKKQPDVMLQWRCLMAIARQVYPDITLGIYDKDELE